MIAPALPVPLWVFNPFKYNPEKGLKPTKEEALPPDLLNRLLKQTAKERLRRLGGWPILPASLRSRAGRGNGGSPAG